MISRFIITLECISLSRVCSGRNRRDILIADHYTYNGPGCVGRVKIGGEEDELDYCGNDDSGALNQNGIRDIDIVTYNTREANAPIKIARVPQCSWTSHKTSTGITIKAMSVTMLIAPIG